MASETAPAATATPSETTGQPAETSNKPAETTSQPEATLSAAQNDGIPPPGDGAPSGLNEPEYDVNVTLADLQANKDHPLYSAQTFEELNLYVTAPLRRAIH